MLESPATDEGARCNARIDAGSTVMVQLRLVVEASVAMTVTPVELSTPVVVIGNDAQFEPAGTVTDVGIDKHELPELRVTMVPLAGAMPLRVTVPGGGVLPPTICDCVLTLERSAG